MELFVQAELPEGVADDGEALEPRLQMESFLAGVEQRAFGIARVSVRDPDEALDIVQEAMIRLVRRYSRRPSAEWPPLFYRILRNCIRDWQRRRSVRGRILSFLGANADGSDAIASAPAPAEQGPLAQIAGADAMEALAEALRSLPRRQREAFVLRNFEGLGVAETARAMGCSGGSVKTHYSRALNRLRALLGEHWP